MVSRGGRPRSRHDRAIAVNSLSRFSVEGQTGDSSNKTVSSQFWILFFSRLLCRKSSI